MNIQIPAHPKTKDLKTYYMMNVVLVSHLVHIRLIVLYWHSENFKIEESNAVGQILIFDGMITSIIH
jgi:hypothetical protein